MEQAQRFQQIAPLETAGFVPPYVICPHNANAPVGESKIQWAPRLLERAALDRMRIDHRRSDIAVAEQLLNRANVVIGLQEVACKTVIIMLNSA